MSGITGATFWFWITPVGVTNYVNKITFQMALESPETLTYLGMIDNTILDFHSDELDDYTKEKEEITLRQLVKARSGLNQYGPKELSGQELVTWEIAICIFTLFQARNKKKKLSLFTIILLIYHQN